MLFVTVFCHEIVLFLQPFHSDLYSLDPEKFFVQTFRDAIKDGTSEGFRKIMMEPSPGLYTFDMLQPLICAKLLDEVSAFIVYDIFLERNCLRIILAVKSSIFYDGF